MSSNHVTGSEFPAPADPALDSSDVLAITRYGSALLEQIEQNTPRTIDSASAAALVAELDDIRHALSAADAAGVRRQAGFLGRLLGRDVEAQHRAENLFSRLDTQLLRADAAAARLRSELGQHAASPARVERAALAIRQWAAAGEQLWQQQFAVLDAPSTQAVALRRRLDHLHNLAAVRDVEVVQLQLLQAQAIELLERYQRIREVLIPAWRQQSSAAQASQAAAQLQQAADSQRRILTEVEAMQARLR